ECVAFCRNVLGLQDLFENEEVTCFAFGGSYLMVEPRGRAHPSGKSEALNPTCLRLHVADIKRWVEQLRKAGVEVAYSEDSWGAVAKFFDPDGHLWALRDEGSFAAQLPAGAGR